MEHLGAARAPVVAWRAELARAERGDVRAVLYTLPSSDEALAERLLAGARKLRFANQAKTMRVTLSIGEMARTPSERPTTVSPPPAYRRVVMGRGGVEGPRRRYARTRGVGQSRCRPGLGRITGNTDFSTTGITDDVATVDDPYLQPFEDGIKAGAGLVMVSSAQYPKIDAKNAAMFSRPIISELLRGTLRYDGVVITDDVGVAKAGWRLGARKVIILIGDAPPHDGDLRHALALARQFATDSGQLSALDVSHDLALIHI